MTDDADFVYIPEYLGKIRSRYNTRCPECGSRIAVGDMIYLLEDGDPWVCKECGIGSDLEEEAVLDVFERWGRDA